MRNDIVRIVVNDPCNPRVMKYETYTSKNILCNLPIFKSWFDAVEIYQDFIEIGNEGYNGVSNLMLFNTYGSNPYLLGINCDRYVHDLGMYDPPIICDVINYCTSQTIPLDDKRIEICKNYFTIMK